MIAYLRCVAEAVVAKGVRGLVEWVPGGPYLYDVAADAGKRLRERKKRDEVCEELRQAAQATFEEAKAAAERVAREVAAAGPVEDRIALELYLSQVPGAVRKSLRRAEDHTGRSVPPDFLLGTPDDLIRVLPPQMPRFRTGQPLPGRPGWALLEPLGAGGFGEVWKVGHDFIPDVRAVKFCTDPAARHRLLAHEGKLVARVMREGRHPNVVPLVDADLSGEAPWLAYEFVGGGDLAGLILSWQTLPAGERVGRAVGALRVLATTADHFHRLAPPLVHRDLKPSNILVATDGALRVTDLGIGGIAAQKLLTASRDGATAYTRAVSMVSGAYTPIYAGPQQQRGEPPDPRDDVHALGVIAFQMLTGRLDAGPGPRFDRDLRKPGVPDPLVELIGDCIDPEAGHRPADGAALLDRLKPAKPTPVRPVRPAPPPPPEPVLFATERRERPEPILFDEVGREQAEADYNRGEACYYGRGVPQDYAKARKWYEKAAAQGYALAQNMLGMLYHSGHGVTQDYAVARRWWELAAGQGDARAQFNLGNLHSFGHGVPQDHTAARGWYETAAAQGFDFAEHALGNLYEKGEGVPKDPGTATVWYEKAATRGLVDAQYVLALRYEEGLGVTRNREKALKWYRKAAAQDHPLAERAKSSVTRLEQPGWWQRLFGG